MRRDLSVHCGNTDMAWIGQYGLSVDWNTRRGRRERRRGRTRGDFATTVFAHTVPPRIQNNPRVSINNVIAPLGYKMSFT